MIYTLNNLISDLKEKQQDSPIIFSKQESPKNFEGIYINQVCLTSSVLKTDVKQLKELAQAFILTQKAKDPDLDKEIYVIRSIGNRLVNYKVTGITDLIHGSYYIEINE